MRKYAAVIFLTLIVAFFQAHPQDGTSQFKAVIHLNSTVSEGQYSLWEIAAIAQKKGISAVIVTDRDQMKWEYGFWPLRRLIKKKVELKSVFEYGIERYLEDIEMLRRKFPGVVFIAGVESAPFYYWEGSLFQENLTMHDWHKHILAVGLNSYDDYRYLPVIGNREGLKKDFAVQKLWPFATLVAGLLFLAKRKCNYKDARGVNLGPYSKTHQFIGAVFILISLCLLFNNWPFYNFVFDQYHGDLGQMPYQNFIDYVGRRGGLTFWAHPEAEYIRYSAYPNRVGFVTRKHSYLLSQTENYTGFCVFPEGYKEIGKPGGVWDEVLKDYCYGRRAKPVWAVGGLAFERGDLSEAIERGQTILLSARKDQTAFVEALREGRIYVVSGKKSLNFSLDEFFLSDEEGKTRGYVGDTISIAGKPILHIKGGFLENHGQILEVDVIRKGEVVKRYKEESPFSVIFEDQTSQNPAKSYYRLEIKGQGVHFLTNPIFFDGKVKDTPL